MYKKNKYNCKLRVVHKSKCKYTIGINLIDINNMNE